MPRRLPKQPREWIDRSKPLQFRFEGKTYYGFAGDTISSALLANGVQVLGRSFKYHRRRGVFSLANHDCNAMLQSSSATHIRADVTPLSDGMELSAVNTIGGLRFDWGRVIEKVAVLLPVGFYYKIFHKPKRLFPFWERLVRQLAGLGKVSTHWPRYEAPRRHAFCDVLVIGSGPSGLAAARRAVQDGAKVTLVDEHPYIGGSLNDQLASHPEAGQLLQQAKTLINDTQNLTFYPSTYAAGYYADHWLPLVNDQKLTRMRVGAVIIASGVFEQPAVFRNNDLPGVMLASAALRLLHRYSVMPCHCAVLLVANREGYEAALDLKRHGVDIRAIVDLENPDRFPDLAASVQEQGITLYGRHVIHEAHDKAGRLCAVTLRPCFTSSSYTQTEMPTLDCDGLLMSVGWSPAGALLYQAGAKLNYEDMPGQLVPKILPDRVYAAGRVNGVYDFKDRLADGEAAANEALAALGFPSGDQRRPSISTQSHSHPYPIFSHPKGRNFIDLDEDLQVKDLETAVAEGFNNIELLKRYSTVGMGPSQGKHANMNAIRLLARLRQQTIDETGSTTARPFYHPVALKLLAGRRLRPYRHTALHNWHRNANAVFMPVGHWQRPRYYGPEPEAEAVKQECHAIRQGVGLIDVSTLGKIEIVGADAAEFLDHCYTNRLSTIKVGMTRYALMVDEAGVIVDDGVAARLGEQHFYVSTTTTGADSVYREMQRHAIEWGLDVHLLNRSGANAAINLAGPLSREVLAPLTDVDLSPSAFPFLGVRLGKIAGVMTRIMRVGFVGELGYEIHVPTDQALHIWQALMEAGKDFHIQPFGVEAQRQLRLEKGHLIVGQDTDGNTTPWDAGLVWAVSKDKAFFIGQRSLSILREKVNNQLVGFRLPVDYADPLPEECNLVIHNGKIAGRVTSIGHSQILNQVVGLAMVSLKLSKVGNHLMIRCSNGRICHAEVVEIPFYDPGNARQKVGQQSDMKAYRQ